MTSIEVAEAEKILIEKEQQYSKLMRKSYEVCLNDRERGSEIHDQATELYEEIKDTRIALDRDPS